MSGTTRQTAVVTAASAGTWVPMARTPAVGTPQLPWLGPRLARHAEPEPSSRCGGRRGYAPLLRRSRL
ncbi:hypothetical protein [Streptomyces sp. NPDC000931]|uniref:hypothetical protein n=1 Tax=Streptomyces sp. NPDC000931 TaxID=3154372 RepID=UPI00331F63D8